MNTHGDNNTHPPFNIRIVKKYADCLSRQVEEAFKIFYYKDQLLNSKSEYVQNCLARINVNETKLGEKRKSKKRRGGRKSEFRKAGNVQKGDEKNQP